MATVGGPTTAIDAFAVFDVALSFALTVTLLFFIPTAVPVTFTATVHELFEASVDPLRLTDPEPAVAVTVPPQLLVSPFGVATIKPAGRLSVKPTPVSEIEFAAGFVIVNVSEVVAPS